MCWMTSGKEQGKLTHQTKTGHRWKYFKNTLGHVSTNTLLSGGKYIHIINIYTLLIKNKGKGGRTNRPEDRRLLLLLLFSAIHCSQADSLCSCCTWFWMSDYPYHRALFNIHLSASSSYWQHNFVVTQLVPHETAAVSGYILCTPYTHLQSHFIRSHIPMMHACLSVTCHLHFWQNGWDLQLW